jgi:NAD(P)-dependent dehydrogenase (short-subunit alcohol dehydrogenase family)
MLGSRAGYEVVSASRSGAAALDLASFASVDRFVESLRGRSVDVLVNNAGAMFAEHGLTGDGVERTLAVNCLGPLRLTESLTPKRTVNVVTSAMGGVDLNDLNFTRGYGCFTAYLRAKLAFMHVVRVWAAEGRHVQNVHPGMVRTAMLRPPAGPMRFITPLLTPFAHRAEVPAAWVASRVEASAAASDALFVSGAPAAWPARLRDDARNAEVASAVRRLAAVTTA